VKQVPKPIDFNPSSDVFRLSSSPFYLIAHADFMYHDAMEKILAKHGITKSTYRILTVLREAQPCSVTYLADTALIKRTTVSRIIERMVQMNLVTTAQGGDDGRVTEVRMTAEGKDLLDRLTPMIGRLIERATEGLTHAELTRLVGTLQIMSANLSRSPLE
jgi:MarR family transcriptional regulator, organic hydroperoxide resistance regulator